MNELLDALRRSMVGTPPWLIGVGGPVAVGKSTIAEAIAAEMSGVLVSTDDFLHPNAVLAARQLTMRKGFPESYDADLITATLRTLRGGGRARIPVYSHRDYDIVAGRTRDVIGDVVVIEGVMALQPPLRGSLDVAIYVDAPEEVVRAWYVSRFIEWTRAAADDDGSFYSGFSALDEAAVRSIAEATWDAINAVNLRDHIAPSRANADLIVRKGPDHVITGVTTLEG